MSIWIVDRFAAGANKLIYQIVIYKEINDPTALAEYAKLAGPAIVAAGGRFIARGMPEKILEQGEYTRTVIIEWTDLETALAGFQSPGYAAALEKLGSGATRDIRYVAAAE